MRVSRNRIMSAYDCAYGCGHNFFDEISFGFDFDEYFICPYCKKENYCYSYDYIFSWADGGYYFHDYTSISGDIDYVMVKASDLEGRDMELLPIPRYIYFMRMTKINLRLHK